jgi:hypothetical protein
MSNLHDPWHFLQPYLWRRQMHFSNVPFRRSQTSSQTSILPCSQDLETTTGVQWPNLYSAHLLHHKAILTSQGEPTVTIRTPQLQIPHNGRLASACRYAMRPNMETSFHGYLEVSAQAKVTDLSMACPVS